MAMAIEAVTDQVSILAKILGAVITTINKILTVAMTTLHQVRMVGVAAHQPTSRLTTAHKGGTQVQTVAATMQASHHLDGEEKNLPTTTTTAAQVGAQTNLLAIKMAMRATQLGATMQVDQIGALVAKQTLGAAVAIMQQHGAAVAITTDLIIIIRETLLSSSKVVDSRTEAAIIIAAAAAATVNNKGRQTAKTFNKETAVPWR
jgi:hypothetical protein